MNKETKAAAVDVFERYPHAKTVFVTPDNQAFVNENSARIHDKDYMTVNRVDVMETIATSEKGERKSAIELIETIKTCEKVEELDAIAEGEDRKTVLAAIAEKRAELTKPE